MFRPQVNVPAFCVDIVRSAETCDNRSPRRAAVKADGQEEDAEGSTLKHSLPYTMISTDYYYTPVIEA
jgi:hypothetical protein